MLKYACDQLHYERWQHQKDIKCVRFSEQVTVREPEIQMPNYRVDENTQAMGDMIEIPKPERTDDFEGVNIVVATVNTNTNNSVKEPRPEEVHDDSCSSQVDFSDTLIKDNDGIDSGSDISGAVPEVSVIDTNTNVSVDNAEIFGFKITELEPRKEEIGNVSDAIAEANIVDIAAPIETAVVIASREPNEMKRDATNLLNSDTRNLVETSKQDMIENISLSTDGITTQDKPTVLKTVSDTDIYNQPQQRFRYYYNNTQDFFTFNASDNSFQLIEYSTENKVYKSYVNVVEPKWPQPSSTYNWGNDQSHDPFAEIPIGLTPF